MKKIMIDKRVGLVGKVLLAVVLLTVMAQSAFAVTDRTWITNASSGQIAAGGNCRYIAYYKGSDDYLQTEDSWNSVPGYANSNAGYTLSGSPAKGYCDTNSSYYPDPDPASTDTYDIWISSIADGQAGHGNGTVGAVSPSYVPAGNGNSTPLALSSGNYLAMPGNFKVSSGNGRVVISWNAVAGATGYKVYRGPVAVSGSGTGIYQRIADTASLFTEDASVANGTTYYYIIFAYDATRRGVHTDQLSATPSATSMPSITNLNPTSGAVGSTVTITGSNFGASQGTGFVMFNGVVAAIISWSNTQIVATVPTGATTGNVYVVDSSGKTSNGVSFTVSGSTAPTIISCSPAVYAGDTSVTVSVVGSNTNFVDGVTGATISPAAGVNVNNVTVTDSTHATINVSIDSGTLAGSRNITMTTNTEIASGVGLFVIGTPSISITPSSGDQGATLNGVAIAGTGTHFNGATTVMFPVGGSVSATNVVFVDATHLTCDIVIDASAATGARNVVVTTGGEIVNGTFTVTTPGGGGGEKIYERAGGIMMAYPNPFNPNDPANPPGGLQMLFNTATGEAVDIYIFDTNARVIYQTRDHQLTADRIATWDGETSYGETAQNGLYLIRVVKSGKLVAKGKILVIKK